MTKFIKYYFDRWWCPLIISLIIVIIAWIANILDFSFDIYLFIAFLVSLGGIVLAVFYQLFKREWESALVTLFLLLILLCLGWIVGAVVLFSDWGYQS